MAISGFRRGFIKRGLIADWTRGFNPAARGFGIPGIPRGLCTGIPTPIELSRFMFSIICSLNKIIFGSTRIMADT